MRVASSPSLPIESLRLYPLYAAVLALTLLLLYVSPYHAQLANPAIQMPATGREWFNNLLILNFGEPVRLLPPTWSLTTEIAFYGAFGLFVCQSAWLTKAFFAVFGPLSILSVLHLVPIPFYGHPIGSAGIFLLGATAYHYSKDLTPFSTRNLRPLLIIYLTMMFVIPFVSRGNIHLILASLVAAVLLPGIAAYEVQSRTLRRAMNFAGDLAYPIFLSHWACAAVVLYAFGVETYKPSSGALFLPMLLLTIAISALLLVVVETPIKVLRRRVRGRRSGRSDRSERLPARPCQRPAWTRRRFWSINVAPSRAKLAKALRPCLH